MHLVPTRRAGCPASKYLRLIDSCITQLKAQGPSRTCDESKEKKKERDLPCADEAGGVLGE